MKVMGVMDPNSTKVHNLETLAKCPYFDLIKFQYSNQTHYQVMPRWLNGVLAVVVREDGRLVMIRQSRPFFNEPQLEFVMGGPNKAETLEDATKREVKEETGYSPLSIEPLMTYSPLPSAAVHNHNCFVVKVGNTPTETPAEPDQPDAKVVDLSIPEVFEAIKSGSVISYAYAPLLHYLLKNERVAL